MALQEKYAELVTAATASGVTDLQVREQENVLYVDGTAPTGQVKDQLWDIYGKIDPDFRAGDLVLNVAVAADAASSKYTVTTESSNLNVRKGPGTDQPIVGKAAHGEVVTFLSKYNEDWYLIRTDAGEEGYSNTKYLTAVTA